MQAKDSPGLACLFRMCTFRLPFWLGEMYEQCGQCQPRNVFITTMCASPSYNTKHLRNHKMSFLPQLMFYIDSIKPYIGHSMPIQKD